MASSKPTTRRASFNDALRIIDKTLINEYQLVDLLHHAANALFCRAHRSTCTRTFDIVEWLDVLSDKLEESTHAPYAMAQKAD